MPKSGIKPPKRKHTRLSHSEKEGEVNEVVIQGQPASHTDPETNIKKDVKVVRIDADDQEALIEYTVRVGRDKGKIKRELVDLSTLGSPINPPINKRFEHFTQTCKLALNQRIRSLLITGEGGLGKSYTVESIIQTDGFVECEEGEPDTGHYAVMKGNTTPRGLFDFLEMYKEKVIILDDIDSVFMDKVSGNILKAALDTKDRKIISWATAKGPRKFEFKGAVIFLTNLPMDYFESAILSRSVVVDLHMTADEKMERLLHIAPKINEEVCSGSISNEDIQEIMSIVDDFKETVTNLNARTLVKAFQVYKESNDMDLVRYQLTQA